MGRTYYGKDASACESTRDLETKKWISVVQHQLAAWFTNDMFGYFDSKGKADAHTAELVTSFNDPGLSSPRHTKEYKDAMAHRSEVLARHESLGRVAYGSVRKRQDGKYEGQLPFNGKQVLTLCHAERRGAETELASLRSTLLRGGTLEEHRLRQKAECVGQFHAEGTAEREEMEELLEQAREGTNGNVRVILTRDGHEPVREKWNGKKWNRLCSTPRCMAYREHGFTNSDKCYPCGGGCRCCGPNGKGCPFHMTVVPDKNRCDNMCVACFVEENFGSDDPEIRERLDELSTRHRA